MTPLASQHALNGTATASYDERLCWESNSGPFETDGVIHMVHTFDKEDEALEASYLDSIATLEWRERVETFSPMMVDVFWGRVTSDRAAGAAGDDLRSRSTSRPFLAQDDTLEALLSIFGSKRDLKNGQSTTWC